MNLDKLRQSVEKRTDRQGPDECWPWIGSIIKGRGHGQLEVKENGRRRNWPAHRLAYFLATGELPEQVHHVCENKSCVNPNHLEGLTFAEHQREHFTKEVCKWGHDLTVEGARYSAPGDGRVQCSLCLIRRNKERNKRERLDRSARRIQDN